MSRNLSDLDDRSEQGGRASTEVHDIEAHSGSMQRDIGELWAALPPAHDCREKVRPGIGRETGLGQKVRPGTGRETGLGRARLQGCRR